MVLLYSYSEKDGEKVISYSEKEYFDNETELFSFLRKSPHFTKWEVRLITRALDAKCLSFYFNNLNVSCSLFKETEER